MANLRDRGYSSSMDNYNQQQEKKKRQQEQRRQNEATNGPVSAQKAKTLTLPKVNSTANSRAASQSAPKFGPPVPTSIKTDLHVKNNYVGQNLKDRGFSNSIIDNTLPMPEKSEKEFYSSPLLVENYGNYYNYARGERVTRSGFKHVDHDAAEADFKNRQAQDELEWAAVDKTLENLHEKETNLAEAMMNSGVAPDYMRYMQMQAQLETMLASDPNAERPETKVALSQYESERERYEHMDEQYRVEWNDFHNIYARNKAYGEYKQAYETATKMVEQYNKTAKSNADQYNAYVYSSKQQRDSVRGQDEIQADWDELEERIKALQAENRKLGVGMNGADIMSTALSLFPAASAAAAEQSLNANDKISRNNAMIQELRAQQDLLHEEWEYSRYLKWDSLDQEIPVSARRAVDKNARAYGIVDEKYTGWNKAVSAAETFVPGLSLVNRPAGYEKANLAQMLPEERERYKRIYENYGEEKAREYLEDLNKYSLNTRRRFAEQQKWQQDVGNQTWWGEGATWLNSVLLKPLSMGSYANQLIDYLGDGKLTKDASYNRASYLNTAVRQQIGEDFGNFMGSKYGEPWKKHGQFGYQVATSILDNVYNMLLTAGIGNIAGASGNLSQSSSTLQSLKDAEELTLMVMGTEAAADQTIAAMDRGLSSGQAMVLGTGAGLIEILTEKVSLDKLLDGIGDADSFWKALKNVGAQGLVEGSEEFAGSWLDTALDNWVAQDKSEFREKVNEYKRTHRGASDAAAFQAVWNETFTESLTEAGSGLVSGLLMSGGGIGINAGTNYVSNRNAITNPDYVGSLIKSAQSLDQNSAGYQAAQELQSKLSAREQPTYRQVRNAERAIDTGVRTGTDYVQDRISTAEKYKGTEAATKAALLQEKIDRGESVSYRDVVDLETATNKARATSSEYLSPLVEIGKANAENSPAYKAAVKVEQKLQSGQEVTARESAQLEKAANESLKEAFDSGNAEVIGSYMISDNGARALTDAATILKNSTSQSDVRRGNEMLQAIKDGNLDAKTAGEVFLRSQKILENTRKQRQNIRVLKPREVTADMDAYDRTAAELGISEEEAAHNKAIMQAFGVEGEYKSFENNNLSAYYDRSTGKVYINANAQNPGLALIAHEVTHSFENTAGYKKLASLVFGQSKDLNADLQRITQEYADAGINLDDEGARSELVSEFVEQHMFNDEKFINDVVSIDRSLAQRFLATIDNLLAKLGNKNAQQRKLLREARDLWAEALQQRKTSDKAKANIAEKRSEAKKLTLPATEAKAAAVEKQYSINKGTEALSLSKIADEQDLRDRLTKMRVEFDQLREERNRLTQSEEYKRLVDRVVSGDDGAVEAYGAWEKSSGYGDIAKKMDKAQEQMSEGWKKLDQMIEKRMVEEERAAIKKSGLSEAEYFRKAAVKEFGYTPYFYDAGYILPNGKMLNFSGEKGRHFGSRGQDHRAIGVIYANEHGSAAMNRFMNDGNIRIMAESPGLDISNATAPTREQYATIRRFVNEVRDEEYFNLDFSDERGNNIGSIEYDGRVSADRVANDIRHFFQTGEVRQPSVASQFRYAINKDATLEETTQQKINRAMTMQQAKDMIQRAFVLGGIKEYYDGEYRNGDEWLKGVGPEDVALIIDNEWTLQDRYINQNKDILNEEYFIEDVLKAYLAGTLTGQVKQTRAGADLSKGVAVADSRFYAPQQVQAAKETLATASQRITNANRAEVAKARAQILLYAHNPGAAETLGLTNAELNKRLRQWSGYSARAREVSQRINQGVADAYKWTGIENSSWLYGASVTKDDIARMVNSIEGDADGYETSYIARTMLALDTHLDWSWLNIKFDTKSGVQKGYGGDKTSINGYFNGDKSLVHVNHYAPNTVAHEMGHALDYRWGTEFGQYYKYLTRDYKLISSKVDGEVKAWVDHFGEFCKSLWDSSSIVSEYSGKIEETFARFVDKFVEWTQNLAQGRNGAPSRSWYNDKFTQAQFVEFAKILQEKAALDAKGLTKNTIPAVDDKLSLPKAESKQYAIGDRAVYIKDGTDANGNSVSFTDLILDGQKLGETRNTRNLPVGEWVGITKGGKNPAVVGRVIFGNPIRITNQSPEYADAYIEGTNYDLKDGESKWYYPIEQVEDFRDNPRKMTSNAPVMGRYQYAISKATVDSSGRDLTDDQLKYFDRSKIRNKDGQLLTMYHGTTAWGEITKFKRGKSGWLGPGIYMTSRKSDAQRYADAMGPGNGQMYEVYANVTNPLVVTTDDPVREILAAISGNDRMYNLRLAKNGNLPSILTSADIKKLQAKGYDGIRWDYGGTVEVSVFDQNQIKRTDNQHPTSSPDVRYAISKSDTAYLKAVESGDMETAQRMVDEAARKTGYRTLAYHGSPKNNIHIFDGWNGVSYFTNDERYAKGYAWGSENGNIIRRSQKAKRQLDNQFTTDVTGMPDSFDVFDSVAIPEDYDGEPGKFFADGNTDAIYYAEDVDKYGDLTYKQVAGWHTVYDERTGMLRVEKGVGEAEEEYRNEKQHMIDAGNGVERPKVYRAYLKMENPYISRHPLDGNRFSARFNDGDTEYSEKSIKRLNELKDAGYDGVIVMSDAAMMNALAGEEDNAEDVLDYVVFDPTQIKSADPVTYDDSGSPIPLSERFNPENKDIRYSIKKLADGRLYVDVDVDQHLFDGLSINEMRKVAKREIRSRFAGRLIGEKNQAYVRRRSWKEFTYPANKRIPQQTLSDKLRTAPEIDNILDASTFARSEPDNGDHPWATGGRKVYDTLYRVGGRVYSAETIVEITDDGPVFYDVTKIKEDTLERSHGLTPEGASATQEDVSGETVSQSENNVNSQAPKGLSLPVAQAVSSAKTSLKQVPALFTDSRVKFGKVNVDIGGGKYDLASDYLKERGTQNLLFDPYNRDRATNRATLQYLQDGNRADTATCANVLNVIAEPEARANVILEAAKSIKDNGTAYFMVYEGDGSGNGKRTSAGWQNNMKTADYVSEIEQYFDNVERRGKLIIASNPKTDLPQASWEVQPGEAIRYAINKDATIRTESELIDSIIDPKETAKAGVEDAIDAFNDSVDMTKEIPGKTAIRTSSKSRGKPSDNGRFLYRKMVDSGEAVSRLGRYANDSYLYPYYNMARASSNAAISMIQNAQTDVMGRRVGDSLNDIFSAIRAKGDEYYSDLQLYLYHLHNIARMSRANPGAVATAQDEYEAWRKENPEFAHMLDSDIKKIAYDPTSYYHDQARQGADIIHRLEVAQAIQNKPIFGYEVSAETSRDAAAKLREKLEQTEGFEEDVEKIRTYIDNLMQYRIDSGLFTEEQYEKLKKIYPDYVPVFYEYEAETKKGRKEQRTEIGSTVGRAQGVAQETPIMPLHKALAQQTMSAVREGSKNRFGQRLLDKQNLSRNMIKGIDILTADFNEETFDQPDAKRQNAFVVRMDGKRYEMTLGKDLYEAIDVLSPDPKDTHKLLDIYHKAFDLFKAGVTGYNPVFAVKNPIRDLQDAGLYSKDLSEFVKQYPKTVKEIRKNGKYWQLYQALGGLYSSVFDYEKGELEEHSKIREKTLDRIETANMAVEQMPRLAEFMATIKKAEARGEVTMDDLMEAMHNAADVTVNFGRSGKWGKWLNRNWLPFFNPGIQGADKFVRRFTETKGAKEWALLTGKAALFGILPAILNKLLWGKRKDWDELKQSDRDNYYLFPLKDGVWLRLPKGRALALFGMATDRIIQGKDADWASFIKTGVENLAPKNPLRNSFLSPWVDADLFDKDSPGKTWYGGDIESQRLQNLAPGQRYDTGTDKISKWLGKTFNLSPKKINYILDQYSGVIGDFLLPILSDKPGKDIFSNAFTIDTVTSNRLSSDFYDMSDKLNWEKNDPNTGGKNLWISEATYRFWNKQSSDIAEINKAIRGIEEDKSLSDKEKRDLLRVQYTLRNGIMRNALDALDDYRKAAEDAVYKTMNSPKEDRVDDIYREANYQMFGAEYALKNYDSRVYKNAQKEFEENGTSFDDYYKAYFGKKYIEDAFANNPNAADMDKKQTKYAKWEEAAKSGDTGVLKSLMSESEVRKYQTATDNGIDTDMFITAYKAVDDADKANDNNGSYKQDEVTVAIDSLRLTNDQKAILWQVISSAKSGKNNPFNPDLGQQIYDEMQASKSAGPQTKPAPIRPMGLRLPKIG